MRRIRFDVVQTKKMHKLPVLRTDFCMTLCLFRKVRCDYL